MPGKINMIDKIVFIQNCDSNKQNDKSGNRAKSKDNGRPFSFRFCFVSYEYRRQTSSDGKFPYPIHRIDIDRHFIDSIKNGKRGYINNNGK